MATRHMLPIIFSQAFPVTLYFQSPFKKKVYLINFLIIILIFHNKMVFIMKNICTSKISVHFKNYFISF